MKVQLNSLKNYIEYGGKHRARDTIQAGKREWCTHLTILTILLFKLYLLTLKKLSPEIWRTLFLAYIVSSWQTAVLPLAPKANRLGMGPGLGWGHLSISTGPCM